MPKVLSFLFLLGILLNTFSWGQCLKADILFLLDWSGSEDSNQVYIPTAVLDFTKELNLGPSSAKIGVIPFNDYLLTKYCIPLTTDKDIINGVMLSLMTVSPNGGTRFIHAFNMAQSFFEKSHQERQEEVLKIIIFISDGDEEFDTRSPTLNVVDLLKEQGVFVWTILTPNLNVSSVSDSKNHMKQIATDETYYIEEYYYNLKEELLKLDICP